MAAESNLRTSEESSSDEKTEVTDSTDEKQLESESEAAVSTAEHKKSSVEQGNCYCGKERNLNIAELLCANCNRWFHESCIGYQLGKLVPFLTNYVFLCKNCSPTGLESYKKVQAQIAQMCVTAIANLQQASSKDGASRIIFDKDREIIPYIEYHWEALTPSSRRVTQSWYSTVQRALAKEIHALFTYEDRGTAMEGHMYGLLDSDLTNIRPNYDAMIKGGILRVTDVGVQHGLLFSLKGEKDRIYCPLHKQVQLLLSIYSR